MFIVKRVSGASLHCINFGMATDVAQGTGALLSPNDWKLGSEFPSKLVLTMYQVTGGKGWGGRPLWVPNIKLPGDIIYYDVIEDDD